MNPKPKLGFHVLCFWKFMKISIVNFYFEVFVYKKPLKINEIQYSNYVEPKKLNNFFNRIKIKILNVIFKKCYVIIFFVEPT